VLKSDAAAPRSDPRPSSPIRITGQLATDVQTIDIALPLELGSTVIVATHADGSTSTRAVGNGERSGPLRVDGRPGWRDRLATFGRFILSGFEHIIPLGLDHILFIAALALGAPRLGALVKLATVFTAAHSLTLALAAFEVVRAPPAIVEPLIALSIAAVAIENILSRERPRTSRMAVVFAFGLLHGLGFAGVLRDVGLPAGQHVPALLGFNIGVELGQLAVIAAVLALLALARRAPVLQAKAVGVASLAIACVGVFWTVERIMSAAGATLA
jgi:hydrogenase/urease accessory protein HupE